jgi:ABC-type branched-subunit amino acid transport system substrate-binding protein
MNELSANLTRRAIVAYQAGRPEPARELLAEAIHADPNNELAWLWLAALAHKAEEKRYCLERALDLNPEGPAHDALATMAGVTPLAPAYVAPIAELPLPKEISSEQGRTAPRRGPWLWAVAALALLGGLALLAWLGVRSPSDRLYLAVVAPLTGPSAAAGEEITESIRLATERLNAEGGIGGRPVELLVYDDQNDVELAQLRAEEIVRDGRALAVLGHNTSSATLAALPIYTAAGIPFVSGTATADEVTAGSPWSFTTNFNNTAQGNFLAAYISRVLGATRVSIVYTDEPYGRSLEQAISGSLPFTVTVPYSLRIDVAEEARDASRAAAVAAIAAAEDPGMIVLAATRAESAALVLDLRRQGFAGPMIGADAIGSSVFAESFAEQPEEAAQRGFFTDGIYAATPLIYDSAPAGAQSLLATFRQRNLPPPSWRGVKVYNSALALFAALRTANVQNTADAHAADRTRVRDELARLNSRSNSVGGLDGPVFFDGNGAGVTPVAIGLFSGGELLSAPVQLQPLVNPGRVDLAAERAAGKLVQVNGQYLRQTRVVYTGGTILELRDLDEQAATANFDFYLWFRYGGDDNATDIEFVNQAANFAAVGTGSAAANSTLLGAPVEEAVLGGLKYRLYRVRGVFEQSLDLRDYPFDRQTVGVRFQNSRLPRDEIIYVVDKRGLEQGSAGDQINDSGQFANVDNWHVRGDVMLYQDTISQVSSLGDPRLFGGNGKLDFSEFHIDVILGRDLLSFLARNVLPLVLVLVILYVSLFFSHEDQTTDRITTAVTVLLTGAVLLSSIYASLPIVGYTVAIEYGFYVFFVLTLGAVLLALIGSRLYKSGREEILIRLDIGARIVFPIIVLVAVLWYVVQFVPKLAI